MTQYDDGFSCDSPCIALLWEVIHELPLEMKKKFLFFCTGSDRVPIKGLGNLSFVISRNGSDEERLPSAHTCFNHLLLPEYTTKSKLKAQLLKAVSRAATSSDRRPAAAKLESWRWRARRGPGLRPDTQTSGESDPRRSRHERRGPTG